MPAARAGRADGSLLLKRRCGDLFRFPDDGGAVAIWPASSEPAYAAHLVLDMALPLALSRSGEIVLHGAAIEVGGRAVAVLGESGAGKSTVASAWAAAGGRFLADDWFVLEGTAPGFGVRPSHPSLRVAPGAAAPAGERLLVDLAIPEARGRRWLVVSPGSGLYAARLLALGRLVVWRRAAGANRPGRRRLTPAETMDALLAAYFSLELESAPLWATALPLLGALAGSCEAFEVTAADGLHGLGAALELVAA